ncbi:outer membrane lipoprotein-sorting protein [Chryseobacterium gotjawalense]|uniref:Outer membrane lipoprotein-sorting protein n=1 Tax=Chryseobacterium gotjawalense TaxID=3042315 RepID=A0ABY8REW9_9FLAO|nr:outer membrane lipoprotein-sorting protein [Chryseobacterium sp. wdc7]WHF52495.1 outer membrane lipoprotein-sorting protein [Chryseobacterium sp. wdc7]
MKTVTSDAQVSYLLFPWYNKTMMSTKITVISVFLLIVKLIFPQNATEIVRKADAQMRGETMQAEIIIRTVRPTWKREMECKTWMKGSSLAMILIQSPVRDKGIAFLKRKKEVWNWMPALERTIKLPPSMMSQNWMGTDFTNDDLVKESSVVSDYNHTVVGDTIIQKRDCYVIRMVPKPEAAVVWGKVILCIDKKDFLELHSRFYDEDGELINIMNSDEIKQMGGRVIPTRFEMIPTGKKGQKTVMIYKNISYNKPISDDFFRLDNMKTLY